MNPERLGKKTAYVASTLLMGVASIVLTPTQESKLVYVTDITPIPVVTPSNTSTSTPTPDSLATQIANLRAIVTVEARRAAQKTEVARLQEEIDALRGTPTKTATSTVTGTPTVTPTATPTLTDEQIEIKQKAGLLPAYTPTLLPTRTPRPEQPGAYVNNNKPQVIINLKELLIYLGIALPVIGAGVLIHRRKRGKWIWQGF